MIRTDYNKIAHLYDEDEVRAKNVDSHLVEYLAQCTERTPDREILDDAARLTADDLLGLSRSGFTVKFYDTLEDFYLAEALEYINTWRQATEEQPTGICGHIGPTEQLPLVTRLVNELEIDLRYAHFWGMDEWVVDGKDVDIDFPLSFAKTDMELCFNRIRPELRMPLENIHFPMANPGEFVKSWDKARCLVMQGGQGEVKHWAFNDPPKREGDYLDNPPRQKCIANWGRASLTCIR